MCPDRKTKWFKDHGRTTAQVREIKAAVTKRWKETYAHLAKASEPSDVRTSTQVSKIVLT